MNIWVIMACSGAQGAGNNEFFWNHYFMNLDLDSNNDIVNFNFSSNIAAER